MPTVRQRIIDLIQARAMDAREISTAAGVGEKEVYVHMEHIARSVSGKGKTFRLNPAACLACGYVFRDRRRMTRPSRCPRCKAQRVSLPTYSITG
ncbi:MAG: transcriptional regulator [Desulfobacterales bacterium]|nr:transcriptional regulator [Desulfobacterales bacterium]